MRLFLVAIFLALGVFAYLSYAEGFYARQLRHADAVENVVVGSRVFEVQRGDVQAEDNSAPDTETATARRLAFAAAQTRTDAMFGITGTDPDDLSDAVIRLRAAVDMLAQAQETPDAIEAAHALFPLAFFTSLAELEAARSAFLDEVSDQRLQEYLRHLEAAAAAYEADIAVFRTALEAHMPARSLRIPGFAGTITDASLRATARALETRSGEIRRDVENRIRCLEGETSYCVDLPRVRVASSRYPAPTSIPDDVRERIETFALANPVNDADDVFVALESSVCVSDYGTPHYVRVRHGENGESFRYISEIYFIDAAGQDVPTLRYLLDSADTRWVLASPLNFYHCPEAAADLGLIRGVLKTAEFARANPSLAPEENARLLQNPAVRNESEARRFLEAALDDRENLPQETVHELEMLAMMFEQRSAGMADIVEEIDHVVRRSMQNAASGIPYLTDARSMFISHTAFPSLFLAHHPSVSVHGFREQPTDDDRAAFERRFRPYGELRPHVPRTELIEDITALLRVEGHIR